MADRGAARGTLGLRSLHAVAHQEVGSAVGVPVGHCQPDADGFNDSADIGFFDDEPTSWLELVPGCFAIFHPQDAHAPLSTDDEMLKVVVKIALDW